MNAIQHKSLLTACLTCLLLAGCATERGTPPVVEAGTPLPGAQQPRQTSAARRPAHPTAQRPPAPPPSPPVMVETFPAPPDGGFNRGDASSEWNAPSGRTYDINTSGNLHTPTTPSGIPGGLAADEKLDGPVLALLSDARTQQGDGNLSGAAASLERAQRIAPREPQVLYRLAEVRLAQGDAEQAEQVAQRALSYAGGRPPLQAALWDLIARAREQRGDRNGAAQARARARVNL